MKKLKLAIGNLSVKMIRFLARKAKIDLIPIAYMENGIMKSYSYDASGEKHFISSYLKRKISNESPIFFDVGANTGDYSLMLIESFPKAQIHSFEPNPNTYAELDKNLDNRFKKYQLGIGEKEGKLNLYFDKSDPISVQATSDPKILEDISNKKDIVEEEIEIVTLDKFCKDHSIEKIDLLKIDTEGFEMEALWGAKELIQNGNVNIIQFEFNEVNVIKRRFLKDFYELLVNYNFYRLDSNRLIELGDWKPIHEIFKFQNIVAVKK